MLVSPELADVLSAIICRVRGQGGAIPLVAAYDVRERLWLPSAPLLFQRRVGSDPNPRVERRTLSAPEWMILE